MPKPPRRMSKKKSRRSFKKGARIHPKNGRPRVMRGGFRL